MPVSVTVYYRDIGDREAELDETLARINRRISMLGPGKKLDAAKERAEKVEARIRELGGDSESDDKMRAKFRKDMSDLAESIRTVIAPASLRMEDDGLVWDLAGAPEAALDVMRPSGMRAVHSEGGLHRYEFDPDALDAEACNRIRQAAEAVARTLWEAHGQETENRVGGRVHADEPEVPGGTRRRGRAAGAAARILARGDVVAGAGRGRLPRGAGGLRLGSEGQWLSPEAELILWIRETMKWINREGPSGRSEIESEIGARVANDPSRDAILFDQAVSAVVSAGSASFDGTTVSPAGAEKREG